MTLQPDMFTERKVFALPWWFFSAPADIPLQQGRDRLVIRVLAVAHVRVNGWIGPGASPMAYVELMSHNLGTKIDGQ